MIIEPNLEVAFIKIVAIFKGSSGKEKRLMENNALGEDLLLFEQSIIKILESTFLYDTHPFMRFCVNFNATFPM